MGNSEKLAKNEQLIRDRNQHAAVAIKKYYGHEKGLEDQLLEFVCECSNLKCVFKVTMSIKEYEKIHKRKDRFVLAKGHENLKIEKITDSNDNFEIVEKLILAD